MPTEYACAFEIVRTFTDEELAHDPDPEEVMGILVRQIETALRAVPRVEINRLRTAATRSWVAEQYDGDVSE
jgi:hypothetical protein